jgi:hypothetical protein
MAHNLDAVSALTADRSYTSTQSRSRWHFFTKFEIFVLVWGRVLLLDFRLSSDLIGER